MITRISKQWKVGTTKLQFDIDAMSLISRAEKAIGRYDVVGIKNQLHEDLQNFITRHEGTRHIAVVEKDFEQKVIAICGYQNAQDEEESLDNAVLIANAQNTLQAAKHALEFIQSIDGYENSVVALLLRSAIFNSTREDVRHLEPKE